MNPLHAAVIRSEAFAEDLVEVATPATDRAWIWLIALVPLGVALLAVGVALLPPLN